MTSAFFKLAVSGQCSVLNQQKNPQPTRLLALYMLLQGSKPAPAVNTWLLAGHLWIVAIQWGRKASQEDRTSPNRGTLPPLLLYQGCAEHWINLDLFRDQLLWHSSLHGPQPASCTVLLLRLWWRKPCEIITEMMRLRPLRTSSWFKSTNSIWRKLPPALFSLNTLVKWMQNINVFWEIMLNSVLFKLKVFYTSLDWREICLCMNIISLPH